MRSPLAVIGRSCDAINKSAREKNLVENSVTKMKKEDEEGGEENDEDWQFRPRNTISLNRKYVGLTSKLDDQQTRGDFATDEGVSSPERFGEGIDEIGSGDASAGDDECDEEDDEEGEGEDELAYPGFVEISFRYLDQETKPRSWCLVLITNPWFERISMLAILLNCVTLGMYQPCVDDKCLTNRCKVLQMFDDFIFAFFALEMTIKMIAMGVYGKGTYLADSWNRLDCFIVMAGALEYCMNMENVNFTAIRTIRVLRPLRAINRIPSMRILVMLLLDTLPMLGNVLLLCFFVFFIFGIIGVQLWEGILRQRCFLKPIANVSYPRDLPPYYQYKDQDRDYICSQMDANGMHTCDKIPPTKMNGLVCNASADSWSSDLANLSCINWNQYYTDCKSQGQNPFQGTISFDNIGLAWVAIFVVISLEGWVDIMYYIQDAHSFWDWIYFVLLIVIGSFFMINLCLVVIATQFSETKKREMERMRMERARFHSTSTLASSTNNSEPTSCYAEMIKYIAHVWRRAKRRLLRRYKLWKYAQENRKEAQRMHKTATASSKGLPSLSPPSKETSQKFSEAIESTAAATMTSPVNSNSRRRSITLPIIVSDGASHNHKSFKHDNERNEDRCKLLTPEFVDTNAIAAPIRPSSVVFRTEVTIMPDSDMHSDNDLDLKNVCSSEKMTQTGSGHVWQPGITAQASSTVSAPSSSYSNVQLLGNRTLTCQELLAVSGAMSASLTTGQITIDTLLNSLSGNVLSKSKKGFRDTSNQGISFADHPRSKKTDFENRDESADDRNGSFLARCFGKNCARWSCKSRIVIKAIVNHSRFQQAILLAILVNTLSMGIEYHNQPYELTVAVEISNVVFSLIFAVEMLMKITAGGLCGYISNGFNVFDGVIVILSIIELGQSFIGGYEGNSGLSVLRTFRLLRILKLVRFMPNLRRQLFVMLRTMDNVAVFFSLLILFIFIFSILGMYLFGGKFCMFDDGLRECNCEEIVNQHPLCHCDRKHFNNVLWATVTVFQILTQEDWNIVLFNGMEKTSHWASLYFVALMTFGNYVLFNLLVAILVEGFQSERSERREREQRELLKASQQAHPNFPKNSTDDYYTCCCHSDHDSLQTQDNFQESGDNQKRSKDCEHNDWQRNLHLECNIKCNLQKEMQMNHQVITPYPILPIITHTAATPQDSPNNTESRAFNNHFTSHMSENSSLLSIESIDMQPITQNGYGNRFLYKTTNANALNNSMDESSFRRDSSALSDNGKKDYKNLNLELQRGRSWGLSKAPLRQGLSRPHSADVFEYQDILAHINNNNNLRTNSGNLNSSRNILNNVFNNSNNNNINNYLNNNNAPKNNYNGSSGHSLNGSGDQQKTNEFEGRITNNLLTSGTPNQMRSPCNLIERDLKKNSDELVDHHPQFNSAQRKSLSTISDLKASAQSFNSNPADNKERVRGPRKLFYFINETGILLERTDYSLWFFPPENRFRQICNEIVNKKWFDNLVLCFIALNCITLAMERPNIPPDSAERKFLSIANYVFTVVFAVEMLIKVVAAGMFYGEEPYFQSGWNIMDGFLVSISIVDILMSLISDSSPRIFGILRVFRLLRSLRPLRVINRAPGLKLVVQTLLSSLRPIGNIVLICCTFFIIFGILGVQLFKGSFYHCEGSSIKGVRNKTDCLQRQGNVWINRKYNFDDLGKALMSLFVLSSKDGWVNIMYTGLDAVGVDQQPIENYSEWRLLYFISFILLVGFFVLNMFVGVVVENFHRCREEQEKEERVRRLAKRAKQLEKKRKRLRAPPYFAGYGKTRLLVHSVVTSKYFDLAIAAVIGLNVVTMAMEFYMMPKALTYALKIFNYFFTAVFVLESIMKLLALGIYLYVKDRWNLLDIGIVILSIVGIALEEMESKIIPINPTIIRVMRVMRIARVLKLLKMAKGIRALLNTVMQALPQVGNLGLLFFLLFFIFAALGVELFGRLECSEDHPCQGLGEHAHFSNFGMAFLTLFRVATGDNWNGIMKDTLREDCDDHADCVKNCCVSAGIAPMFFVIFVLMAQFVLVNVVVAVLMKHLEESHKQMEDDMDMDEELERELEEDLCVQLALEHDVNSIHPPLTKVLSLPADFTFTSCHSLQSIDRRESFHSWEERRPNELIRGRPRRLTLDAGFITPHFSSYPVCYPSMMSPNVLNVHPESRSVFQEFLGNVNSALLLRVTPATPSQNSAPASNTATVVAQIESRPPGGTEDIPNCMNKECSCMNT